VLVFQLFWGVVCDVGDFRPTLLPSLSQIWSHQSHSNIHYKIPHISTLPLSQKKRHRSQKKTRTKINSWKKMWLKKTF
jgi:hypothetical protein